MKTALLTALALVACTAGSFFLPDPDTHLVAATSDLERTVFADALEAPLDPTRNTIWCASLPLAWKELQELLGGEVMLAGAPAMARRLNAARSARSDVHPDALVAGAGFVNDGIVERLQAELRSKFGRGRDPVLDRHAAAPNLSLLAYAFLYRSMKYATPFEDLAEEPLTFRHRDGERVRETKVDAFGIAKLLDPGSMEHHRELRQQVLVYDYRSDDDCIVRLVPKGTSDWILLVRTPPGRTLGALWQDVRDRVRNARPASIEPDDSLRVPELDLHLTHRFEELIGQYLLHEGLEDQYLMDCVQDLRLKFDERGVEMKSRAVLPVGSLSKLSPKQLHFDEPFLLLLAKDGASRPYLAVWIAHPEILIEVEQGER